MSSEAVSSTARRAATGVLPALAATAAWLIPPTLYGVVYVRFLDQNAGDFADRMVDWALVWGLAGILAVPILATFLASRVFGSAVTTVAGALVALVIYIPAGFAALMFLISIWPDFTFAGD